MKAPWLIEAEHWLGQREIPGAQTAPFIAGWLQKLGAWWRDDETPWCGTFVGAMVSACGIKPSKHWYRAKDWLNWGLDLTGPAVGAVVVFERSGGGHVGFITGRDTLGRLLVLGGNQGNSVSIAPFDHARVVGYRWPRDVPQQPDVGFDRLPITPAKGPLSSNEA